jgi:hypothetical protein
VRFAIILLLLASTGGGRRAKDAPVSLVLSYLHTKGQSGKSATWVLDDRGRQFILRDEIDGYVNQEAALGFVSLSVVADAIQLARPVPGELKPAEVARARALIARAGRSAARTPRQERACEDGSTDQIFGYLSPAPGTSQRAVLLRHLHCGKTVEENLSREGQQLIAWADRLTAQANFAR